MEHLVQVNNIKYLYTNNFGGGICVSRCLFFRNIFGISLNLHYLCTQYGIELYLDSVFHHRFCDCAGETGVSGRLRCVPSDDGFYVFIVKNSL